MEEISSGLIEIWAFWEAFRTRFGRKTYEFEAFSAEIGLFSALSTDSLLIVRLCKAIEALTLDSGADWAAIRGAIDILSGFEEFLLVFEDFWVEEADLRQ